MSSSMYLKEFSLTIERNDDISKLNDVHVKYINFNLLMHVTPLLYLHNAFWTVFFPDTRTLVKMRKVHLSCSVLFHLHFEKLSSTFGSHRSLFFILRSIVTASSDDENDVKLLFYRSTSFESRDPYANRINYELRTFLSGGELFFLPANRDRPFFFFPDKTKTKNCLGKKKDRRANRVSNPLCTKNTQSLLRSGMRSVRSAPSARLPFASVLDFYSSEAGRV